MTPEREIMPYDGLKPKISLYAAGNLTDPPVSVPRALFRGQMRPVDYRLEYSLHITLFGGYRDSTPT